MNIKQMNCIDLKNGSTSFGAPLFATIPKGLVYTRRGISPMTESKPKLTRTTSTKRCSAFTLVELLVVVGIIALLLSLLIPLIANISYQSDANVANSTMRSLQIALKQYETTARSTIYPDNRDKNDLTKNLNGFLRYDVEDPKSGLINKLARSDSFTPGTESTDSDGLLLDPWGDPYQFVRGNFANKKLITATYDASLPQDTNKPKDANIRAIDSDWNIDDVGGFYYLYSFGNNEGDSAEWLYPKDLRQNLNE